MSAEPQAIPADFPRVAAELQRGEQLLWAGRPDPAVLFIRADLFLIPFYLFFLGFSIFWTVGATSAGAPFVFWIAGTLFIAIGVFLTVGRFFVKAGRKRRTEYAVTDRRAFLVTGRTVRQTQKVGEYELTRSRDGSHVSVDWDGSGSFFGIGMNGRVPTNSGFDGIFAPLPMAFSDVADVDALVGALRRFDA